jgi:hypothetical protein
MAKNIKYFLGVFTILAALASPAFADGDMGTPPVAPQTATTNTATNSAAADAAAIDTDGDMGTPPLAVIAGEGVVLLINVIA